jgi:WD40 repeat protein/DNA-binding SARP family transcriptional activator
MTQLKINLLGPFAVSQSGKPVSGFESDKVRALLAYLAVEADRPHRREALAGLLWSDTPEQTARTNLRSALANLRQVIGDQQAETPYLLVTRQTIQFNLNSDYELDVKTFLDSVSHCSGKRGAQIVDDLPALQNAAKLYLGGFMTGFYLRNAPLFDDWASITREALHRQALNNLQVLTGYHQERNEYDLALTYAQQQVTLEPYQEAAHQQIMWLLALKGQRNEALAHYQRFSKLLKKEINTEPLEKTQMMHAMIMEGEIPESPKTTIILRREPRTVGQCPYRGLSPFYEIHAPFFFGREVYIANLEEIIRKQSNMAVIIGSSGMGKSSVIYAGLLPRLRESGHWILVNLRPSSLPFQTLASSILPQPQSKSMGAEHLQKIQDCADALQEGELSLFDLVDNRLQKAPQAERLLLFVDQFEELYTLCLEPDLRHRFLDVLLNAVEEAASLPISPFVLILTLRADFMGQALSYRPFADALQNNALILGPMDRDELRAAIENPGSQQGAAFETGLVSRILNDIGEQPGNLPLLEFALTLLWERLDQGWLTHTAYENIGRIDGAISRYAEEMYAELNLDEQLQVKKVFVQLVQPGAGTEDTRRVANRTDFDDRRWELIQRLADNRLVVTGRDQSGQETVEVVHEALISGWKRLLDWMEADRSFRSWQEDLRVALRGWLASDKDEGALLRGAPLVQAEAWQAERRDQLSQAEREFIQASTDSLVENEINNERRRRRIITYLTVGLVVTMILALLTGQQWLRADSASELALAREATATVAQGQAQIHAALAALAADNAEEKQAEAEAQADARATQQVIAEEMARLARARELAMASISNLDINPELSVLLALRSVDETYQIDGIVLPESADALHKAVQKMRVQLSLPHGNGVAFSPSGHWLATAGPDNTAHLWDAFSGELLMTYSGHEDQVMNITFCNQEDKLATTSLDGSAKIWDVESGEVLQTLTGHTSGLISPAFSPDGSWLVTTSMDSTARVWDVHTGEELHTLLHSGLTGGLDFSPDGSRLAIADHDAYTIKIWDTTTWQELVTLTGHTDGVNDVVFSPDGSRLASVSSDRSARVWDVESGNQLIIINEHSGFVLGVDFNSNGDQIATGCMDGTAKIWDSETGQELLTLAGHTTGISNVAFNPDGKSLATGSTEGTKIWNVTQEGSREWLTLVGHTDVAFRLDYSPDGSLLATSGFDGTARVWDTTSGEEMLVLQGHTSLVYDIKFNFDGSRLITTSYDGSVILWDLVTGEKVWRINGECGSISCAAFSPDGSRLLTGCENGTAKIWDTNTTELLLTLEGHKGELFSDVFGVDFSPSGEYLATAGWDGTAKLWDATSGLELLTLSGHTDRVNHVAFSPDDQHLATASWDGTAKIWEIPSGDQVLTLNGHSGVVWEVAFSPDGSQLATGGFDSTARIWDFTSGQELLILTGNQIGVGGVTFSPDGRHLAVGGGDGTVRIYILPINDLITIARERLTRSLTDAECKQYLHIETCSTQP